MIQLCLRLSGLSAIRHDPLRTIAISEHFKGQRTRKPQVILLVSFVCPPMNQRSLIAIAVLVSLHGIPSSGSAECIVMEKNSASNTPLSCNFSDVQGKWFPTSRPDWDLGTMTITNDNLRFEHGKTTALTVIRNSHPIMLKQTGRQWPYTRLEVYIPSHEMGNKVGDRKRVLCFHEYPNLADAEADKDAELDNHPSYIHCYGEH